LSFVCTSRLLWEKLAKSVPGDPALADRSSHIAVEQKIRGIILSRIFITQTEETFVTSEDLPTTAT
jgi:hypothetical protein